MTKIVLITGATSGFGEACARKFAAAGGYDLILTGRRSERLDVLKRELGQKKCKVHTLTFDVRDKEAVAREIGDLPPEWRKIDILFNNAGLALGRDYFDEASMDDWETMIDTNLKGLLYITRAVLPLMIGQPHPHIINMGSVAGKEVYEKGNAYCASKFAVDAISRSMRIDLLRHAIKVTAIHPGAAETEFSLVRFKGDEQQARKIYEGFVPLIAEDIADAVFYCATLPPHVCINDLVITCTAQADAIYFHKKA